MFKLLQNLLAKITQPMMFSTKKLTLPGRAEALAGRQVAMSVNNRHFVSGNPIVPPYPDSMEQVLLGLGCFWGAERKFWQCPGVFSTAVGYAGGYTLNPTYEEVCSGMTGHAEVVRVIYDPALINFEALLALFWTVHNPTQGMRQGNDIGTQYRSAIYTYSEKQFIAALQSKEQYQQRLAQTGFPEITTEISAAEAFYYAEDYHQQYLAKEPNGYCGLNGLGVTFD
jgi:peptide-methionine (S)-S-oxide reductase